MTYAPQTKRQRQANPPTWLRIRQCREDPLQLRALVKSIHGLPTLQNVIRGEHGLPNSK